MSNRFARPTVIDESGRRVPDGERAASGNGRTVGELLKRLSHQSGTLVREEVELAKTEMSEKLSIFQRNLVGMLIGTAILLAAVMLLVEALNRGLTVLLENWVPLETAVWLAPLVLGVVLALIGYALIRKGASSIKEEGVTPEKTVATLRDDVDWAERKVKA